MLMLLKVVVDKLAQFNTTASVFFFGQRLPKFLPEGVPWVTVPTAIYHDAHFNYGKCRGCSCSALKLQDVVGSCHFKRSITVVNGSAGMLKLENYDARQSYFSFLPQMSTGEVRSQLKI